jgi:hypothetical protein
MHSHRLCWHSVPEPQPLQSGLPCASSWHTQLHVAGSSTRVAPHAWVRSQTHWHATGSKTKPEAQLALVSQTQSQAAVSQVSYAPQPPQSARHEVVQVARSHCWSGGSAPRPQSAGHCQLHEVVSQTKAALPPGGALGGVVGHSQAQSTTSSQTKLGPGAGEPQPAGHSQAHWPTSHTAAPEQPPQSAGQRQVQLDGSQAAAGPGAALPSQTVSLQAYAHVAASHCQPTLDDGGFTPGSGLGHWYSQAAALQT